MLVIRTAADMDRAVSLPLEPPLRSVLCQRTAELSEYGDLGDLAHFVIAQPADELHPIEEELGFSPLTNLVDGRRFGDPEFVPSWEWIQDHGGLFECVFVLSDDGFGHVLFVPDRPGVAPELLALCHAFLT